ncbi:CAC3 Proproteinase, partial [Polypterus senegalus]
MTAGHCISASRTYRVVLEEYDLSVTENNEQIISVAKIVVHPLWNSNCVACGNDIALIKLSRSATLNDKVMVACLPEEDASLPDNYPCYISGWGRLYTNGPLPAKLQQALLPVVSYERCSQRDWWSSSVKKTMVCAGGDIKSGCNGDSGGPLICKHSDDLWYVHGVTSFVSSLGCNTVKKPTVFTRVSSFIPWIEDGVDVMVLLCNKLFGVNINDRSDWSCNTAELYINSLRAECAAEQPFLPTWKRMCKAKCSMDSVLHIIAEWDSNFDASDLEIENESDIPASSDWSPADNSAERNCVVAGSCMQTLLHVVC